MFYYHDTFEPKKFKFHVIIALVELMWVWCFKIVPRSKALVEKVFSFNVIKKNLTWGHRVSLVDQSELG